MKILQTEEHNDDNEYRRIYKLDNNVTSKSIIEIIRSFEGEKYVMSVCRCNSYSESGAPDCCEFSRKESLANYLGYAPNPSIKFGIEFKEKETNNYAFRITAATNYNYVSYIVDKKKLDESKNRTIIKH